MTKSKRYSKNTGNPILASPLNTSPKFKRAVAPAFVLVLAALAALSSGCGPKFTYPAAKVPEEVKRITREEFLISVDARVVGRTLGAMFHTDFKLDANGQVDKEVHDKMGKVMQAVTRVALSTDLPIDFATVSMRDPKDGTELTITRSLDDTRRANAEAIGIEESMNRTLFGQAKLPPGRHPYDLKEITLEDFLSEQIVQRIRFGFLRDAKNEDVADGQPLILAEGGFRQADGKRIFRFSLLALKSEDPRPMMLGIFKIINQVLEGYRYSNFDFIEIQDYLNRQKLVVDAQTLMDYQQKRIGDEELLNRFLTESASLQEAFKLFGFALPQDQDASSAPAAAAATT